MTSIPLPFSGYCTIDRPHVCRRRKRSQNYVATSSRRDPPHPSNPENFLDSTASTYDASIVLTIYFGASIDAADPDGLEVRFPTVDCQKILEGLEEGEDTTLAYLELNGPMSQRRSTLQPPTSIHLTQFSSRDPPFQ